MDETPAGISRATGDPDVTRPEQRLRRVVAAARPRLESLPGSRAGIPRSEGKWSPKEIIGHLVDSASNNHQRFVRAQFTDDLLCSGYDQNEWVARQRHASAPWDELVSFWALYNLHLARVIEACPSEARSRARLRHNLHEVAFRVVPPDRPATLEYLMADYVDHLEHHLAQIPGAMDPPGDRSFGA